MLKHHYLSALFVLLFVNSWAQFSRSVYTTEQGITRNMEMATVNGEVYFACLRESVPDTLKIMVGKIDSDGQTSDYQYFSGNGINFTTTALKMSGAGVNSSGNIVLAILSGDANGTRINYAELDLTNNSIMLYQVPTDYINGVVITEQKDDSLITYIGATGGGIERVATSIETFMLPSVATVDAGLTYNSPTTSTRKGMEFFIDNGNEYVVVQNTLLRRELNGTVTTGNVNGLFIYSASLVINPNNEIVVFRGADYTVLDQNLIEISTGSMDPALLSENQGSYYAMNYNGGYRIWKGNFGNGIRVIDIDANFNESEAFQVSGDHLYGIHDAFGGKLVFGELTENRVQTTINGTPFIQSGRSSTFYLDNLQSNTPDLKEYQQEIQSENIIFNVNHLGIMFANVIDGTHGFQVTDGGVARPLMYSAGTSILGKDANDSLVGSLITFQTGNLPGPYTAPGNYTHETMDNYSLGYYVTRDMIENHITNSVNGTQGYTVPFGIAAWPTEGNSTLGQAADLAEYVDRNGNGTYDPENGDYPKIYGDQCILNIYHTPDLNGESDRIECHEYVFTFDCDTSEALKHTVFIKQLFFARDGQSLDSVYYRSMLDFDTGYFGDDYVGTNVRLGMVYGYNGDALDESGGGIIGFNDTIPATGQMILQGTKLVNDSSDNPFGVAIGESINGLGFGDGIADNEYYSLEASYFATNAQPFPFVIYDEQSSYFASQGLYPNGSPKQVNGVDVRYDYFGTSDGLFYGSNGVDHGNNYSEASVPNAPGDRRIHSSSGPGALSPSDTLEIITAYVYARDSINPSVDNSILALFEYGETLKQGTANNSFGCGNSFDPYISNNTADIEENVAIPIGIYPNPTNNGITVTGLSGDSKIVVMSINGTILLEKNTVAEQSNIDLSNFTSAVYIVIVNDNNGSRSARVIKN